MTRTTPLIVLLALAAAGFGALDGAHATTIPVKTILGDEVYEDGTYTFRDPILVPAGSSLTIRNATVWLDACVGQPADCPSEIHVDGGTLRIENATIDTNNWAGASTDGYHVNVYNGVADLQRSTFLRYTLIEFRVPGPVPHVVRDNEFSSSIGNVHFSQGAGGEFSGNLVRDSLYGVQVDNAHVAVLDNAFRHVFGWRAIYVFAAAPYDATYATSGPIQRNLVEDSAIGIHVGTGDQNLVEDNVVLNATYSGIEVSIQPTTGTHARHPPFVRDNRVEGALTGLSVSYQAPVTTPPLQQIAFDARENDLVGIACNGVRWVGGVDAGVAVTVDVRDTWWGSAAGPTPNGSCAAIEDNEPAVTVLSTPWATPPNT